MRRVAGAKSGRTMPVIITADTQEELPEGLRAVAKEADGRFVIDKLPDGWGVDNVGAYRQKLTQAEKDAKRRDDRLKGYAKDDKGTLWEPEEIRAALAEVEQLKSARDKAPNLDEMRKSYERDAEAKWRPKYEGEAKRVAELDSDLDRTKMDAVVGQILAEAGAKDDASAQLLQIAMRDRFVIDKSDGKRVVRVKQGDGYMTGTDEDGYCSPKTWVNSYLKMTYPALFRGDDQSGAGASGTSGAGQKRRFTFKRSDINGKAGEFIALQERAKKAGETVHIID
jgi:hypothetical protein